MLGLNRNNLSQIGVLIICSAISLLANNVEAAVIIPPGEIGGIITSNSVLSSGNTYVVTSDVTVGSGATLTVNPGVVLRFTANTSINVDGRLLVNGTATQPITFTSSQAAPTFGAWGGIVLKGSGSVFNNAIVEYSLEGVYFNNTGGEVHDSVIRNNNFGIKLSGNASPQITNGNRVNNNYYGIFAIGTDVGPGLSPTPIVSGNSINNNVYYNYYAFGYFNPKATILDARSNWWGTTVVADIEAKIFQYTDFAASPVVSYLPFLDAAGGQTTTGTGLAGTWSPQQQALTANTIYEVVGNFRIPGGTVMTVPTGVQFKVYGTYTRIVVDGSIVVQGSVSEPVTFTSSNATPTVGAWGGIDVRGAGSVFNNVVVEYANEGLFFDGANGEVHNSILRHNNYGIRLRGDAAPQITNRNAIYNNYYGVFTIGDRNVAAMNPTPVVTGNSIYNNGTNYFAYWYFNAESTSLDASNNWWGTTVVADIEAKIFHHVGTVYSPVVNYLPYSNADGGQATRGSALAGTWSPQQQPITANATFDVVGDFVIPATTVMTVPQGVQFKVYGQNTRITVDGSLVVQGTATEPVTFTSSQAAPSIGAWGGIDVRGDGSIFNNAIVQYAQEAIFFDGASGEVHNSILRNNYYGIRLRGNTAPQITNGNVIYNNNYGIFTIGDQNVAAMNPMPLVAGSSIYDNIYSNYFAYWYFNEASTILNASNNWWGTTDILLINENIDDGNDFPYSPIVAVSPFLQGSPTPGQQNYLAVASVAIDSSSLFFDSALGKYYTLNSVTNADGENIRGPIRLVVKNASIPVLNADGYTYAGEPFFVISTSVDFHLATGATIADVRIEFENDINLTYDLVFEVVDSDTDAISDAYERQVGTDPGNSSSSPSDSDRDGVPDVINDLIGVWAKPCRALGGGEYVQEELVIGKQDFRRNFHNASSADCQARWMSVSNQYNYAMQAIGNGNIGETGIQLDLTLQHVYATQYEPGVSDSLNQFCTKQDFPLNQKTVADAVHCQGNIQFPNSGDIHYDILKNTGSLQLGNKSDVIDAAQRAVDFDASSFSRVIP